MKLITFHLEITFVTLVALVFSGCTAREARWHVTSLREHTLLYYEDQIMDNLIRAKNGQLFVHVDLDTLAALVTDQLAASVGGGETVTRDKGLQGGALTAFRSLQRPFAWSVAPTRSHSLTVNATTLGVSMPLTSVSLT